MCVCYTLYQPLLSLTQNFRNWEISSVSGKITKKKHFKCTSDDKCSWLDMPSSSFVQFCAFRLAYCWKWCTKHYSLQPNNTSKNNTYRHEVYKEKSPWLKEWYIVLFLCINQFIFYGLIFIHPLVSRNRVQGWTGAGAYPSCHRARYVSLDHQSVPVLT